MHGGATGLRSAVGCDSGGAHGCGIRPWRMGATSCYHCVAAARAATDGGTSLLDVDGHLLDSGTIRAVSLPLLASGGTVRIVTGPAPRALCRVVIGGDGVHHWATVRTVLDHDNNAELVVTSGEATLTGCGRLVTDADIIDRVEANWTTAPVTDLPDWLARSMAQADRGQGGPRPEFTK